MADQEKSASNDGLEGRPALETKFNEAVASLKKGAKQALRVLEQKFADTKKSLPTKTERKGILSLHQMSLSSRLSATQRIASGDVKDQLNQRKLSVIIQSGQDLVRFFGDTSITANPRFYPPEARENDAPVKIIDALRDAIKAMVFALEEDEPDFVVRTRQDAYLEALHQSPVAEKYLPPAVQELIRFILEEATNALLPIEKRALKGIDLETILKNLSPQEKLVLEIIEREKTLQNSPAFREEHQLDRNETKKLLTGLVRKGLVIAKGEGSSRIYIHPLAERDEK